VALFETAIPEAAYVALHILKQTRGFAVIYGWSVNANAFKKRADRTRNEDHEVPGASAESTGWGDPTTHKQSRAV